MKKNILAYFNIYKKFYSTSMQVQLSFRTSFVLIVLLNIIAFAATIFPIIIIFNHTSLIGPWNKDQFLFFTGFLLVRSDIHTTIFSHNFWMLGQLIKRGDLDYIFLRPFSSIFSTFFRYVRVANLVTLPIAIIILIYFGIKINLNWVQWVIIPFALILSVMVMGAFEILLSMSMFWLIDGLAINFLRMQFQDISDWPSFIYQKSYRVIFTFVIPILLVVTPSVKFIFNPRLIVLPFYQIITFIILSVLIKFTWKKAINKYESASS